MNLVNSSSGSRSVSGRLGPIVGGAFMGGIGGAVTAAESAPVFPVQAGAVIGVIVGAGGGVTARPLLRHGARGGLFPRTRPAAGTILAALSLVLTAVVAVGISLRVESRLPEGAEGLFAIPTHVATLLVVVSAVIATVTAMGLAVRRAAARWTAVVMSSILCAAALTALLAAQEHLEEPAALLISALATLAFSLAPSTGQDFRNA